MFSNLVLYTRAFTHSWEAGQFRTKKYDLSVFTPASLHPDFRSKYLSTYAQAAGSGRAPKKSKGKISSAQDVSRKEDEALKAPPSLPHATRRFYVIRNSPAPHLLASRIAKNIPDIVATSRSDCNCLLRKGFFAKVNDRCAVSLTITDPHTPACSYSPYFDALSCHLNQSYPTGSNPWVTFTLAPPAVQLAIPSVLVTSSQSTTSNCFPSSSDQSRTQKGLRSSQPGTLTRTEILYYPRKRLWWLSPSTPTMCENSSLACSSSRPALKMKW